MRIREEFTLSTSTQTFDPPAILEAIRELEAQYRSEEIGQHAYFEKKRALVRML